MGKTSLNSPVGAITLINGAAYDYFCGCGYLGLQNDPEILKAAAEAVLRYGLSTATSRGGYGESPVYDELERQACDFFKAEKVAYFASGYLGAAVLIQADLHPRDHFFIDSDAHYSLWDAAAVSNLAVTPFRHCDPGSLSSCLRGDLHADERAIILTDGLFPISGEIAPLPDYLELAKNVSGRLLVDDAHAAGVLGTHGRGTVEYFGLEEDIIHVSATFNKALGGFGGFLYGKRKWLEGIERNSRILAGSSPPPLPAAAASAKALQILRGHPEMLATLRKNVDHAKGGLRRLGWNLPDNPAPILCLAGREGLNLFRLRDVLFAQGIAVEFVNSYPSAPAGGAIRLAIFATHTTDQIDRLLYAIEVFLKNKRE